MEIVKNLFIHNSYTSCTDIVHVATLALGLRPRQGLARLQAKREAHESHLVLPGVQKSVREWTFTLTSEFPFWELKS
jgi:hypothetical protein